MTGRRFGDLNPPTRLLLGSGPSNPEPRVLRAMAMPLVGQFDPDFTAIMDDVSELIRRVFRTENRRAFPVSGSSRSGLEAALASLIEPGDRVVVRQKRRRMRLLHPVGHDYFELLRAKLRWGVNPEGATSNR